MAIDRATAQLMEIRAQQEKTQRAEIEAEVTASQDALKERVALASKDPSLHIEVRENENKN